MTFDPAEENFHIVHQNFDDESEFKMIGTLIDTALTMKPLIDKLMSKLRPKIHSLFKLRRIYFIDVMLGQFESHIWSHMEFINGAIILAKSGA